MHIVRQVRVEGLFGALEHHITFRLDAPTIITAPNGAGKTHILMLTRAALSLDVKTLALIPFREFEVTFLKSEELLIERRSVPDEPTMLVFTTKVKGKKRSSPIAINADASSDDSDNLPGFIRSLGNDRWIDVRLDRVYTTEAVERRFKVRLRGSRVESFEKNPEILRLCAPPYPVFIDTKRLDVALPKRPLRNEPEIIHRGEGRLGTSRILDYIAQLRTQVTEARRSSILATQSADVSFAARALASADQTVKVQDLRTRYETIVERYEDLSRNSLAIGEAPMEFPAKATPTVRRILNVFLDDWSNRLEPLLPLNSKITALRQILDSKFELSRKRTTMSSRGELGFQTFAGRRVRVSSLSSGEQHLVALFSLLLFSAEPGSLVLIDEPEISLHAAWKHAFLADITRVARIADLQIVMSTHSTAIINGRWDLAEELTFSGNEEIVELSDGDEDVDDLFENQ